MSWNLQLVPRGLLLSKYAKNIVLFNPNSVKGVEQNSLLTDKFQTFNQANNTANIAFQLSLYTDNPRNEEPTPSILGINYIKISNDPSFKEIFTILFNDLASAYNTQTDYYVDLSNYQIAVNTSGFQEYSFQASFQTTAGIGNVILYNWPLSGSSGIKKVFLSVNVALSNGLNASYPDGLKIYDELTVCAENIASPSVPKPIGATRDNYVSSPLYYEAENASNAGNLNNTDSGVASYFWDGLILNSTNNLARNGYSAGNYQIFKTANVLSSQLNQEKFPIVFSTSSTSGSWSSASYRKYISSTGFALSASNNVYFFEAYVNNIQDNLNYVPGQSFFYEFNLVNATGSTKYLRQQLAFDIAFKTLTIYASVDDTTWSTDPTNVPTARYNSITITDPYIVSQLTQSGVFSSFIEVLNDTEKIYQCKLIFKPYNSDNSIVVYETLFTSSTLATGLTVYSEFRFFIQNATYQLALESAQYGICQGTISAAVMPTDKILTNYQLNVENNTSNYYEASELNTWFTLTNSATAGVTNAATVNGFPSIQFFNNQVNDSDNNISATEVQSSVPTFSNEATIAATFNLATANPNIINTAYSFDTNLNLDDFVFDDLLKSATGVTLPKSNSLWNYYAALNYSGTNQLNLNVFDYGLGQTCSISTTKTDNLFFYSQTNSTGSLTPPFVIRSIGNLSTSATFSAWIGTNLFSTSPLTANFITVQNQGNVPISINTSVGAGLNTILPGQPYSTRLTSISSSAPNTFIINSSIASITDSVNFLYDFGQLGTITRLSLTIQIATPPQCPADLPSFKYSVEVSDDFINWTYVSSVTSQNSFNPATGNMQLAFAISQTDVRYARLRLYYDVAVTFDPRTAYRYSLMTGTQTANTTAVNSGKFILGFTDLSAKDASLTQLYDQPTYMRQFISNTSTVCGLVFDFTDFNSTINGPVYLSLLTTEGEERFYTFEGNFNTGLSANHSATLSLIKRGVNDAFYLQPVITVTPSNQQTLTFALDNIITEPSDIQTIQFGFYPFFSLVGNGNINLKSSVTKGTFNSGLDYNSSKSYFSLLSSENVDYTSNYGKNLLAQNTYQISTFDFPQVSSYFQYNTIKNYQYENITYVVKAVTTAPIGLYGETFTDGVYLEACDFVLVIGQLNKATNGVYQVQNKQWIKKNALSQASGKTEPTVLVTEGNVFGDTLWMQDSISTEWLPNVVACPVVLQDNNLLFTGISSNYKYPQYIKLAVGVKNVAPVSSLNQVKLKLLNSPAGYIRETDLATQWNSLLQNGELYQLNEKANSNNTIFMNFGISTAQLTGIATNIFPSTYNLLISYAGNYFPAITNNSDFILPNYGEDYRLFTNNALIYQLFSTYEKINIGAVSTSLINSSVYALSVSGAKSPQSGFSTDAIIDNTPPTVGIVTVVADYTKSIAMSISTAYDTGAGLAIARIVQKNPIGETSYGSWFGFNTSSYSGITSFVAYPNFVSNTAGVATGEPLSGFYQYKLQVADNVGNVNVTNSVESFYYESVVIDTLGPTAEVNFVDTTNYQAITFSTSNVITAKLIASDELSNVKAFRYRILPNGTFGNWLDYNEFTQIFLPESISDGILSIQFQFKDFGNNVLYSTATLANDKVYIYTWNIVSKLINNVLFTVTETSTYNNDPVLLIGASKANQATLYIWDNSKLIELVYPGFIGCKAITAIKRVSRNVVIGTENGYIFIYNNGVVSGPFAQFTWGGSALPISKFEIHQYADDATSYVYATTLNTPRIFRTPTSNLKNLSWQVVLTAPVELERIDIVNTGLWSGQNFFYSISSSYIPASLTPSLSYGISSVIVSNKGSNINSIPTISVGGPITGVGLLPVLQGYIFKLNLLNGGVGYTAGATVNISAPVAGGIQATGFAVTNPAGKIISIGLNAGGQGYGYTAQYPSVTITGNLGFGSQATASAVTQFDSIYAVNVTSAGFSTSQSITLNTVGGAVLVPDLLYRVSGLTISNPGFGYTGDPTILVNGLSTIASATVNYGSIQSVSVTGSATTFPIAVTPNISVSGGFSTSWTGAFSTSPISFSTGAPNTFPGLVLNNISITSSGYGFGTTPYVSFATSINAPIYYPELKYVFSDDITLYSGSGSIYDIISHDDKLFFTSSANGLVALDMKDSVFTADQIELNNTTNDYINLAPYQLAQYKEGVSTSLYFSVLNQPLIGKLNKNTNKYIFDSYQDNILLFRPYNFDVLSNWQLIKIINSAGITTVRSTTTGVEIGSVKAQAFYESTKDNTWFERCTTSNNYSVTFNFEARSGTQSFEISTFTSTLKGAFTVQDGSLSIAYGNTSYEAVEIAPENSYNITFIKNDTNLYIYNKATLIATAESFFTQISAFPVIKFGYLFEPQSLIINNQTINTFGTPSVINSSSFTWRQIKFSFKERNLDVFDTYYSLNIPFVIPNANAVQVLKALDNKLYAATKSINDNRASSNISDITTKIYRYENQAWSDVSGIFETYEAGNDTSYVISSPNDINNLGQSYFVTGLIKTIPSRQGAATISLGLSTNITFEEQQNFTLAILYPYNPEPSGKFLTLSVTDPILSVPSSVYFASQQVSRVINVGVGPTSIATPSIISVSDGISTSSVQATILPIGISSLGLNTNAFTAYSQDKVVASIQLQSIPLTARTINFTSSVANLLATTSAGIITVPSGSLGVSTDLFVGATTSISTPITLNASYRSSYGISTVTAQPFVFSFSVDNKNFVGNQGVTSILAFGSVNKSPIGILTVNLNSSNSSILGAAVPGFILPSSFSTAVNLQVGSAVTTNTNVLITALVPGTISTSLSTAAPFRITSATSNYNTPVLGLQTALITFTINSSPLSNVLISNIVTSITVRNLIFSSFSTIFAGSTTTSFGISSNIQQASGLAVTVSGAPFGFNTSPSPALTLINDRWRITDFIISPSSIVGGGANANGVGQSFTFTATLNVGLATTVFISSSSALVPVRNILFATTGTGSATSYGFSTGFSTSIATGVAFTAIGPNGLSSTLLGLIVSPFSISSFTTSYIWNGIQTTQPNYTVGGIGATVVATVTLNAYVASGLQTVSLSTPGGNSVLTNIGSSLITQGLNSAVFNLGVNAVTSSISTALTASLLNDGISTSYVNVRPYPSYSAVFYPIFSNRQNQITFTPSYPIPVSQGIAVNFSNNYSTLINLPASSLGISTFIFVGALTTDTVLTARTSFFGVGQTYFVTGYANSGGVFGVGYNFFGELSNNYPVIGPSIGSSVRTYMGFPYAVKTASGYNHNLALNTIGEVWAIGDNSFYQLGSTAPSTSTFTKVSLPFQVARDIFAQNNTSYVISADNSLYSFGGNNSFALGTTLPSGISTSIPTLIATSVQLFSAYENRGTLVTYNNSTGIQSMFEFGGTFSSIVGKGITQLNYYGNSTPSAISNLVINQVNTGPYHTVASGAWKDTTLGVNSSGVFAWGFNTNYQTGASTTLGFSTTPNVLVTQTAGITTWLGTSQLIFADFNFSMVVNETNNPVQGFVTSAVMNTLGIGYTAGATVTFSAPAYTYLSGFATGIAVTNNLGYINYLAITNQGGSYSSFTTVLIEAPAFIGAGASQATASVTISGNKLNTVTLTNPGFGYTTPPSIFVLDTGGGSGGIITSNIIQGQITGIQIVNPGFGYTSVPAITITSKNSVGVGATASALINSNAFPLTILYMVGSPTTSNNVGFGLGTSVSQIAKAFPSNSTSTLVKLDKVIKNKNHYIWVNTTGNTFVSGGATQLVTPIPAGDFTTRVHLYAENNDAYSNSDLYSSIFQVSNPNAYTTSLQLFGYNFGNIARTTKLVAQPSYHIGANDTLFYGGFGAALLSNGYFNVYYFDTFSGNNQAWTYADYNFPPNVLDITISRYTVVGREPRERFINIFFVTPGTPSGTNLWYFVGTTASSFGLQSLSGPVQVVMSRSNGVTIDSGFIFNFKGSTFSYLGVTYPWDNSTDNVAIGFQDGTIELWGNPRSKSTGVVVEGGIAPISSWNPDGTTISCLKSVQDWAFPNPMYLFAATQGGKLFCYISDGDPTVTVIQTTLAPTQSLPLLNVLNIPSIFGYIQNINMFSAGYIIASTSENYVLVINITKLTIDSYILVPGVITSITSTANPANLTTQPPINTPVICVTVDTDFGNLPGPGTFYYYIDLTPNYEIALNYANMAGSYEFITPTGSQQGMAYTGIYNASTSDSFTVLIDSTKPAG